MIILYVKTVDKFIVEKEVDVKKEKKEKKSKRSEVAANTKEEKSSGGMLK